MTGVIAQVAISTMGIRVPANLEIANPADWLAWFKSQQVLLPPRVKSLFQVVAAHPEILIISKSDHEYLLTGIEPEPTHKIRIRWCAQAEVNIIKKELSESLEWELEVPASVFATGEAGILRYADEHLESWRGDLYLTAVDEVRSSEPTPAKTIEGPLIWVWNESTRKHQPLKNNPAENPDRPKTINDLFWQTIRHE
jgi:hypothetical protein